MTHRFFYILLALFPFSVPTKSQTLVSSEIEPCGVSTEPVLLTDSLNVPLSLPAGCSDFLMAAPGFDGCSPWWTGAYGPSWNLHQGLNAQLGMSVTAAFGRHAPSGVGFGQHLNLAYAMPISPRLTLAGGVYVQNMNWGSFRQLDAGVAAVLGLRLTDRISLYAYGAKSLVPQDYRPPMTDPFYLNAHARDRIGAMAEFKLGDHAIIQVSVERSGVRGNDRSLDPVSHRSQSPIHP